MSRVGESHQWNPATVMLRKTIEIKMGSQELNLAPEMQNLRSHPRLLKYRHDLLEFVSTFRTERHCSREFFIHPCKVMLPSSINDFIRISYETLTNTGVGSIVLE